MMQSSDLDRKGRTFSPNDAQKKQRTLDNNSASRPKLTPIHSPEMSSQDISHDESYKSEIPLTDIPQPSAKKSEEALKITETNGKISQAEDSLLSTETHPPDGVDTQHQEGFLPVLKNPNFLALWAGQVFCQLADKVYL
ncbi:MAG: hypothetical protein RLZZ176_567, partial [Cyanobacteriota bacterium]